MTWNLTDWLPCVRESLANNAANVETRSVESDQSEIVARCDDRQERRAACAPVGNEDNEATRQARREQLGESRMSWSMAASTAAQRAREIANANAVAERTAARRAAGRWNICDRAPDRAPDDRRRKAAMAGFIDDAGVIEAEWNGDLDLREEFGTLANYRAWRLAETRGQIGHGRKGGGQ